MKTTRRDGFSDEVERDEHGHRLIDCVACDRKRTPQAHSACAKPATAAKRGQKRKPHLHAQGQQKEQIRLTKLYSQMMTAAMSVGMDDDDIRQLQMLLQPYLQLVPRLLNTADISFLFEKEGSDSP